jgi:anti-anti-sigma factor
VCNHDLRASPPPPHASALDVYVSVDGRRQVVNVSGELDMGSRHVVEQACRAGEDVSVVVEMAELTFMDCAGYAGLLTARRLLQAHGGSLTLSHQAGQPARLMALLGAAESVPPSTGSPGVGVDSRFGTPAPSGASVAAFKVGTNGAPSQ